MEITGACPKCGKKLKLSMTIWDGNAADFLDGVAAHCEDCGDVVVDWARIDFFSLKYKGQETGQKKGTS